MRALFRREAADRERRSHMKSDEGLLWKSRRPAANYKSELFEKHLNTPLVIGYISGEAGNSNVCGTSKDLSSFL